MQFNWNTATPIPLNIISIINGCFLSRVESGSCNRDWRPQSLRHDSLALYSKSLLVSALKRRKLSDSQGAKELLARKEKLGISMVFLKSRKHWKRVSCSQVTCIHTGIKITCVLVGWGEEWQGFSRPWSHTKDCFSSLLSYFATISLEDECLEL